MKKYRANIHAHGLEIPVDITLERRLLSPQYGLNSRRVVLRMPLLATEAKVRHQLVELEAWVVKVFSEKPALREAFSEKVYRTGDLLEVSGRRYTLQVHIETRSSHTAKLKDGVIVLQISDRSIPLERSKAIKTLLSRVVANDFYPEIRSRVKDWNDRTFRQHIESVNLKYNHSNWGSCSSRHNVNLSTKLLFAPTEVQDYVILHELAHLIEMNHSSRFWALVEQHMPDYKKMKRWLKDNGQQCDF